MRVLYGWRSPLGFPVLLELSKGLETHCSQSALAVVILERNLFNPSDVYLICFMNFFEMQI